MISPYDFHYDLPEGRIAKTPANPRDSAKLFMVNRTTKQLSDQVFSDLPKHLTDNDVLVLNDTKVFPARLLGRKESGGAVEILLLEPKGNDVWEAMAKGLKTAKIVSFEGGLTGTVLGKNLETGYITIRLESSTKTSIESCINTVGVTPIPPYINSPLTETDLRKEYQTVYAREKGSAAAPTAGLHFTDQLLETLESRGIQIERVTLHVGPGTFAKLDQSQIDTKTLHHEWYSIDEGTASRLNAAKAAGKRIVAVGTTTCRTLESSANESPLFKGDPGVHRERVIAGSASTTLFIQPGYQFKFVDALITNFHLPESSLLMLVSAFCHDNSFKNGLTEKAYLHAVESNYRFFSFGDAMFIQ